MAKSSICAVPGCGKKVHDRGVCYAHIERLPIPGQTGARRAGFGEATRWFNAHIAYQGDDCLAWPFLAHNQGYGQLSYKGEKWLAHRLMTVLVHGAPPSPDHIAAHSCGKGHLGCVNPKHLSWKTVQSNHDDKFETLSQRRGYLELAEAMARIVKQSLSDGATADQISSAYGISAHTIGQIGAGSSWGHIAAPATSRARSLTSFYQRLP